MNTSQIPATGRARARTKRLAHALLGFASATALCLASAQAQVAYNTVATIAAMRALGATPSITSVYVSDYASVGDGGGGDFVFITTASPPAHDGCTVFIPTAASPTGYWHRQLQGPLNVDMCGAAQVSDSSTAINAALAVCSANSGLNVALSPKYYQLSHNLVSDPACTVTGAPSAGVGGVNTYLDFTNDMDGGPCWSIVGTAAYGNFSDGNSVGDFVMLGNGAGNPSLAHCSQGLYVSRVAGEHLHDVTILTMNGPCLFWGSTITSDITRVNVSNCGTATTAMAEIDGETHAGADVGGTTLTIDRLNAGNGASGAQAGVKIDRYGIVNWSNGGSENSGIPLMIASKSASTVGVGDLTLNSLDLENPSNGASDFIEAGAGWSGTASRGVVNLALTQNTLVADATTIGSAVVIKNSSNTYAWQNSIQTPNSGSVLFDFQGSANIHENLFLNDAGFVTPSFTYAKVNGAAVADAVPATLWSVDNAVQPSTYVANTTTAGTVTLTPTVDPAVQKFTGTPGGNIVVTLSTSHASTGFRWKIAGPSVLAGHTFTVNGVSLAAKQWIEFSWDGTAYQQTAAGTLL